MMAHHCYKAQLIRHRRLFRFLVAAAALSLFPFYALSQYGDSSSGLYGSSMPPETDRSCRRRHVHRNQPVSSCNDLFGLDSRKIHERSWVLGDKILTRPCIVHGSFGISAWDLGTVVIDLSKILGLAHGNETVVDVFGRSENEEQLAYTRRMLFCCLTIALSRKTQRPLIQSQALVTFVLQARDNYLLLPLDRRIFENESRRRKEKCRCAFRGRK